MASTSYHAFRDEDLTEDDLIQNSMDNSGEEEEEEEEDDDAKDDMERMRRELIRCISSINWEDVIKIYKNDPRAHKIKLGKSGNTALHMAVASGEEDVVEELVKLINERSQEDPLEVLSIRGGDWGSTPLHLAASLGSIRMCKCLINSGGGSGGGGGDRKQQLLGARDYFSGTPMHAAVSHAKKNTFLLLYEMCDSSAQAHAYCHLNDGITVLHTAIANGYWDLAFQIIPRLEGLMDSVNDYGNSPLHVLAQNSYAFRSGISLNIFENIIYNCIHVEELVPDSSNFKEEKRVEGRLRYPNNYQTCFNFFQLPWNIIKLLVNGGKSKLKLIKAQLDAENLEEGQGYHSSSTTRAQGRRAFPTTYDRCLNFIGLVLSKLVHRSIIVGSTETRTLKGIKETHVWSVQIMNKLLAHAVRSEYEMNPQNDHDQSLCYSEYDVFRRGKAFETPILTAALNGVSEMVEKILQVFPMTIHDRDNALNNIVLIAVKYRQSHIYEFLVRRRSSVVDKDLAFRERDKNRNTILHLAALMRENLTYIPISMLQLQWEVKWYEYVKNTLPPDFFVGKNSREKIPPAIFTETHENLLTKSKEWLNNTCNSCSVIAALISTLAFASSATVPGGVNQDSGKPILRHHLAFKFFEISSLVALCTSFISLLIFFSIIMSKHEYKDFSKTLPRNLIVGLTSLFISMAAMLLCFSSGHFLMLDDHLKYGAVPIYALTFFAIAYFSLRHFPSYYVLLRATFSKVPQRHFIFQQDVV